MMSIRPTVATVKIKSSDGDEFEVGDDVVRELETLKIMTKFSDDLDEDEHVPTCAVKGRSLKKVLVMQTLIRAVVDFFPLLRVRVLRKYSFQHLYSDPDFAR